MKTFERLVLFAVASVAAALGVAVAMPDPGPDDGRWRESVVVAPGTRPPYPPTTRPRVFERDVTPISPPEIRDESGRPR